MVPEEEVPQNRAGALRRIRTVYEANKNEIGYRVLMYANETGGEPPESMYDFFEEAVLNRLTENYGGYDKRKRVRKDKKMVINDVNIEEAIDKTLRGYDLTPRGETSTRNFLNGLRNNYGRYWNFLRQSFGLNTPGATVDGIPLDSVRWDPAVGGYVVLLPSGKQVYFVREVGPNGSYNWVMYDYGTDQIINV